MGSVFFVSAAEIHAAGREHRNRLSRPHFRHADVRNRSQRKSRHGALIAVCCGFLGVLTIIRPGSNIFTWAVLLPIGNALSFAVHQLLTRRLAGLEKSLYLDFLCRTGGVNFASGHFTQCLDAAA